MKKLPCVVIGEGSQSFLSSGLNWSRPNLIDGLVDAPAEGRYLAIVQVRDYLRLHAAHNGGDFFRDVPANIVQDCIDRRCLMILDLSNEGPAFNKEIFDSLHQQMAARGIRRYQCVFVNQNSWMEQDYKHTYGMGGLQFGLFDFFVKLIICTLDENVGKIMGDTAELDNHQATYEDTAKDFLCLNATPRWNRILMYRYLVKKGYADRGLVSFHGANIINPKAESLDLSQIPSAIPLNFPELLNGLETWMPTTPVRFDNNPKRGNELAQSLEAWAYRDTLYSIVTETDFFESNIERITEKAVKAAGLGHPFIIAGAPRSVSWLAELGFETFSGTFDHAYDREADPSKRLRAIFLEIERQQDIVGSRRERWIAETRECAAYNFKYARNGLMHRYERLREDPFVMRLVRFLEIGS